MKSILTDKQSRMLGLFKQLEIQKGISPTLEEWGGAAGVSATTAIKYRDRLISKAMLAMIPGKFRSMSITKKGLRHLRKMGF